MQINLLVNDATEPMVVNRIENDHLNEWGIVVTLRGNNLDDEVAFFDAIVAAGNVITDFKVYTTEEAVLYDLHDIRYHITTFYDFVDSGSDDGAREISITIKPIQE